jgi:hypothetical protein
MSPCRSRGKVLLRSEDADAVAPFTRDWTRKVRRPGRPMMGALQMTLSSPQGCVLDAENPHAESLDRGDIIRGSCPDHDPVWCGQWESREAGVVLLPEGTDQVAALLKYCNERRIPVVPQVRVGVGARGGAMIAWIGQAFVRVYGVSLEPARVLDQWHGDG